MTLKSTAQSQYPDLSAKISEIRTSTHRSDLPQMTKNELEKRISDWRSLMGSPPDVHTCEEKYLGAGPVIKKYDLSGVDLSWMDLRWVTFDSCNFEGTKLSLAQIDSAHFLNCDFSNVKSSGTSFRCVEFLFCYIAKSGFSNCHFEGTNFSSCDLSEASLQDSHTDRNTKFSVSRIYRTDFNRTDLENVNLSNVLTMYGVFLSGARLGAAEIRYELFGEKIGEELDHSFVFARKAYSAIKANLEGRGYYRDAGRAYIKERQMERSAHAPWNARTFFGDSELGDPYGRSETQQKSGLTNVTTKVSLPSLSWFYLKHTSSWVASWFVDWLCGYGESVWKVLFWILAILFIVGPFVFGQLGGLKFTGTNNDTYQMLPGQLQKSLYAYSQYFLYAIDTLTTAGFAEVKPANDLVRLASGITALIGIFLAGLLGFVVGNRIRHS